MDIKEYKWLIDPIICNRINLCQDVKILVLAGPSGCGKTALSKYIVDKYPKFKVVKNYTTRRKRDEDIEGHFEYLSETEFFLKLENNEFFLARTNSKPFYAYSATEINEFLDNNIIPIFMFRHSGVEFLANKIINMFVAFIECDIEQSLLHTQDIEGTTSNGKAVETLTVNKKIHELLGDRNKKIYIVNNFTDDFYNNKQLNDELDRINRLC